MSPPYRIAITGGIGSGKSAVAFFFSRLGVPVIDADMIAREMTETDKPVFKKIIDELGIGFVKSDGTLDRKKLCETIFRDEKIKRRLEGLLHPAIYREIDRKVAAIDHPYCLIVIPLLFETQKRHSVDRILVVDIPEEIQIKRTVDRDKSFSTELIKKVIDSQVKREVRVQYADDIIDNTVDINELETLVRNLHLRYLRLSDSRFEQ